MGGVALADLGHEVIGVDVDETKVALLAAGHPPFYEPGLAELVERNLVRREVIGGSLLHFGISSLVVLPAILVFLDISFRESLLLAIALSFSSTVLAAKVLEGKRELRAFHGRVAIGVR